MYDEKRSEGGILVAPAGNRQASREETEGVQEEREKGCKRRGRSFTEAASQEPRAKTVLRKKEQSTRNGVVT